MVVDWLLDQWALTLRSPPRVRIAYDGFSALLDTFSDNRVTPQQAQFDLVSSIREALARSRATSFLCLSWWSKRNVEVDAWAVAYRHQLEASHRLIAPNARFFTELAALYIGDVKQSRLNPEQVQELVALPALRKRWHKRQTITPEAELETDWTSLARAMISLPAGVQRWTTKHVVYVWCREVQSPVGFRYMPLLRQVRGPPSCSSMYGALGKCGMGAPDGDVGPMVGHPSH
ncbi:unnamed protein product [Cylindrotheca closterium]|uniref:Uncharacterized protein n=1 Tax=Cylindrotheca closterium TaxID=2856 RepID=A0AAD2CSL5_9STRA|nr:unnamed protein product [Cylindrotheca closterium]